jgi:hypothetical protein
MTKTNTTVVATPRTRWRPPILRRTTPCDPGWPEESTPSGSILAASAAVVMHGEFSEKIAGQLSLLPGPGESSRQHFSDTRCTAH